MTQEKTTEQCILKLLEPFLLDPLTDIVLHYYLPFEKKTSIDYKGQPPEKIDLSIWFGKNHDLLPCQLTLLDRNQYFSVKYFSTGVCQYVSCLCDRNTTSRKTGSKESFHILRSSNYYMIILDYSLDFFLPDIHKLASQVMLIQNKDLALEAERLETQQMFSLLETDAADRFPELTLQELKPDLSIYFHPYKVKTLGCNDEDAESDDGFGNYLDWRLHPETFLHFHNKGLLIGARSTKDDTKLRMHWITGKLLNKEKWKQAWFLDFTGEDLSYHRICLSLSYAIYVSGKTITWFDLDDAHKIGSLNLATWNDCKVQIFDVANVPGTDLLVIHGKQENKPVFYLVDLEFTEIILKRTVKTDFENWHCKYLQCDLYGRCWILWNDTTFVELGF